MFAGCGVRAVGANELPTAEKSDFGLYGVVGGMMVIELLAGTMRRRRGGIVAVEDDVRQTYTVTYTEGSDPFELFEPLNHRRYHVEKILF